MSGFKFQNSYYLYTDTTKSGENKKIHFLSDSYSPWNLGSRVPIKITFRALFERKNPFTRTFVKQQIFLESKSIIFRFVRMPIWNLGSFCTFGPMGHWAKPRSGQYFFSVILSFWDMFIIWEVILDINSNRPKISYFLPLCGSCVCLNFCGSAFSVSWYFWHVFIVKKEKFSLSFTYHSFIRQWNGHFRQFSVHLLIFVTRSSCITT